MTRPGSWIYASLIRVSVRVVRCRRWVLEPKTFIGNEVPPERSVISGSKVTECFLSCGDGEPASVYVTYASKARESTRQMS